MEVAIRCRSQAELSEGALTAGNTTQHSQYATLASAHAPRYGLVTADAQRAHDWMTMPRSGPRAGKH